MKIGIDGNCLTRNLTGVGTYLYDVLKYMLDLDTVNEYYIFSNKKLVVKFENTNRVYIVNSECENIVLWYLYILPKDMKKFSLDVFWEPGNRLPIMPSKNVKLMTTVHDMACYFWPQYCSWQTALMEKLFLHKTCRRSEKIICISNSTKNDVIKVFPEVKEKIEVIYNGDSQYSRDKKYDEQKLQFILEKYNIDQRYFLFIGSISPRKNVQTIVKAFNEFKKQGGQAKLVLAGKFAWKSKKIKAEVEASPYKKDIIVTGYISDEDKEYLYKYAETLLFPSLYEGFGFPIIEAMSLGTRVITSNTSSMPEVGGEAALYLNELYNESELASLMKQMYDMPECEKMSMVEKGFQRCDQFSRKETAIRTLKLIDTL